MINQGRRHLFVFQADGGAGDGDAGAGAGSDDAGAGAGTGAGAAGGSGDGAAADRSFQPITSQDQFDRMVKDRIARVKTTPPDDYEDLKAKAAKLDELEESNKSELEKAQARADKAQKDSEAAIERANKRLIQAEILSEATAQKAIRPEHMHRLIDTGEVTVGDDGQVTGAKEAVEGFLKANPEYVGTGRPGGSADQGARDGQTGVKQVTEAELQTMTPEQKVAARKEGRLTNLGVGA